MRSFLKSDGTKVNISQRRGWIFSFPFAKNTRRTTRILVLPLHLGVENKTGALLIEQEHVENYKTRNLLKSFGRRNNSQYELESKLKKYSAEVPSNSRVN